YQTAKEFYDALGIPEMAVKKRADESAKESGKNTVDTAISVPQQEPKKSSARRKSVNIIVFLIVFLVLSLAVWQARTGLFDPFFGSDTEAEDGNGESTEEESVSVSISDSWEEIIASSDDGSYLDKYGIGDMKELDLGEEGLIVMELVAFDADELADGSGKAHMTWIAKDLLNSEHSITLNTGIREHSGWLESDMRSWLRESVLPLFPETVRLNIKKVKKYSNVYSYGTYVSADTIWIPSTREIFGEDRCKEKQGPEYKTAFLDASSRNRQHIGDSRTSLWWTRSASTDAINHFECVGYRDYSSINVTGNELGVVVGFCL
ncbi:MAG: DUF6273 domain-containing protein, partial [Lachnospiraceae bacterium]|nr:DUF6273 domain-containing protein [Lachnospiraceae bacterium]